MQEKKYKTAIYARLSRDDGDASESNSITSQKALCEDFIEKHSDLELVETFTDDGFSGVSFERPGFERLEQAVRSGRIECIVCKDISVKIRSSLEIKRKNGEYVGNFESYGYMKAPENSNVLVVDEYAAGVVSSIFGYYSRPLGP